MKAFLAIFLLSTFALYGQPLQVKVNAKHAILMNADSGEVLFDKKGDERAPPASLTKIASFLYATEKYRGDFGEKVTPSSACLKMMNKSVKISHNYNDPAYFLEPERTHYWIKKGERLTFEDLLYGMMLSSGNDASNTIAYHVSGEIPKFVKGLNQYIKALSCRDTHFTNPHGLHHPKHYSTAYDIALITQAALKNDLLRQVTSTRQHMREMTNLQSTKVVKNKDLLIQPGKFFYPQAVGMKTGYHANAGYTYSGVAKNGKRTLIAVLLGCETPYDRFRDAIRLFEAAFSEEKEERILFNREENLFSREIKGGSGPLSATLQEDISIAYYPSEEPDITIELSWQHLKPPIQKGDHVGSLNILNGRGKVIESSPLIANTSVNHGGLGIVIAAIHGEWVCPQDFQKILIVMLVFGVILTLYTLYRIEQKKKS
ncbi:MAG: D-alanyl-D-alanine carboxypeptidase [Chlamydiia bacterium]|nr:D-alanyl-D-alanine carboxypeptidase [Chlamydiia bacterium]